MAFLTLDDCKAQCRVLGSDEDALLIALRDAAEDAVIAQLNRDVFADAPALANAQATLPDVLGKALDAYARAVQAIENETDPKKACVLSEIARSQLGVAQLKAGRIREGIVINPSILAAMRLIVGHLYANREAVITGVNGVELPLGVTALLQPYRLMVGP